MILAILLAALVLVPQQETVFTHVNGERASSGVAAVTLDPCLTAVANARANDMLQRNYFSHESPDEKHRGSARSDDGGHRMVE